MMNKDTSALERAVHPGRREQDHGLPKYMPQLDSLRGFAVLAVMLFHFVPQHFGKTPLGWMGVRFFFVLSGFLITSILLRERELVERGHEKFWFALRQFYVRRFLRIFPVYYLVLILLAIFNASEIRHNFLWHISYLSNVKFVLDGYFHLWVAHFWTLSVEEQFYILWPTLILFLPRKVLFPTLILIALCGPAYRYIALVKYFSGLACEVLLPASLDTLGIGSLLALLLHKAGRWSANRKWFALAGWAGLFGYGLIYWIEAKGMGGTVSFALSETVFAVCALGVIAHCAHGGSKWRARILEWKPLIYIGAISYGLYVYHELVTTVIDMLVDKKKLSLTRWGIITLKFAFTFLVAIVSWHIFEKPVNRLKRFFPYEKKPSG
jgi:peptidoglycan/LPS O-acetylase OafA/YrhL